MEEKNEIKVDKEELKTEASNTVNQVKNTIKKVDIKKDSIETKGFILDMFKDPLGKIKDIAAENSGKYLTYSIIILVIWIVSKLIYICFNFSNIWNLGENFITIIKTAIQPALIVLTMSIILFVMNQKNKKSLTTVLTVVIVANIPIVLSSIVDILRIVSSEIRIVANPFSSLCKLISVILMYFAAKSLFKEDEDSKFIRKFVIIQVIYFTAYILFSLLGIYI